MYCGNGLLTLGPNYQMRRISTQSFKANSARKFKTAFNAVFHGSKVRPAKSRQLTRNFGLMARKKLL